LAQVFFVPHLFPVFSGILLFLEPARASEAMRVLSSAAVVVVLFGACFAENATTDPLDDDGDNATQKGPETPEDYGRLMMACKQAVVKKWSAGVDEVGVLVNMTMDLSRPNGSDSESEPTLNYTEATRVLAERMLTACTREVTMADAEAVREPGGLTETAVDRLLNGATEPSALETNMTEKERDTWEKALKGELVNDEAPAILGIKVHRVPVWLQCLYLIGVVVAVAYLVSIVVKKLTSHDREKEEERERKREAKDAKELKKLS